MTSNKTIIIILSFVIVIMFGFTFALIPLYNVLCNATGLNGKMDLDANAMQSRYKLKDSDIQDRLITVEFDVNLNRQVALEFYPEKHILQVRPGELTFNSYYVKNLSDRDLLIQAIPSISPGLAAKHLKKLECFCFNKQILKAGESMKLPLRFWLEPEIPDSIHRLTLSYTFFDITKKEQ